MRVYNFAAGPSTLPVDVLEEAQKDLLDFNGTGMSIAEMSHRSKAFMAVNDEAQSLLRELLSIPDDYAVLFVQGGASQQFAARSAQPYGERQGRLRAYGQFCDQGL